MTEKPSFRPPNHLTTMHPRSASQAFFSVSRRFGDFCLSMSRKASHHFCRLIRRLQYLSCLSENAELERIFEHAFWRTLCWLLLTALQLTLAEYKLLETSRSHTRRLLKVSSLVGLTKENDKCKRILWLWPPMDMCRVETNNTVMCFAQLFTGNQQIPHI